MLVLAAVSRPTASKLLKSFFIAISPLKVFDLPNHSTSINASYK